MRRLFEMAAISASVVLLAGCGGTSPEAFQGYVEGEYLYVSSPVGGTLDRLAVARGDQANRGQSLFVLDPQPEAALLSQSEQLLSRMNSELSDLTKGLRPSEIASMEARLTQARADLKLAATELARREQLAGADLLSREELDKARTRMDSTEAEVSRLTADLETARLGGREDVIRAAKSAAESQRAAVEKARWMVDQKQQSAPVAAYVHDTLYRPGEWVGAGQPVVVLLPPDNLKIRFFVPQDVLPRIKPGQIVSMRCDGTAERFKAQVNYISTRAEYTPPVIYSRETRASLVFMVEAKVSAADAPRLRPGQPADITLD